MKSLSFRGEKVSGGILKKWSVFATLSAILLIGGFFVFKAQALTGITVTSPNGGEYWSGMKNITWTAVDCQEGEMVDIKYTTGGSSQIIKTYTSCAAGNYLWNTISFPDNNNYQVIVLNSNNYSINDNSDTIFTIDNTAPAIQTTTLTLPDGEEVWAGGSLKSITWDSTDITDANLGTNPISLFYMTNGADWTPIATGEQNDSLYDWTVPGIDSETVKVRIVATDKAGNTASDESDNDFTIDSTEPTVDLITPSPDLITDATSSGTFTVTVDYNEAMDNTSAPTITFGLDISSTLTLASGSWTDTDIYVATYDVADVDVEVSDIDITVAGAKDVAGNTQESKTTTDLFDIDTENPTITSATATPDPAKEGTITITVEFNENMDTTVLPEVQITGITDSPISVTQTGYLNNTWTGTFTLADNNEEKTATISVTGAKDAAGNVMANNTTAGTFIVDTIDPTVSSIIPNTNLITDNSGSFTVTVDYNEIMQSLSPTIAFNPEVSSALVFSNGVWPDTNTYIANYSIISNGDIEVADVDISVTSAKDLAGNEQEVGNLVDAFDIDIKNPTITSISVGTLTISDSNLVQEVTVTYDEAMSVTPAPTITFINGTWTTGIGSWTDTDTYTQTFTLEDKAEEFTGVDITVIGAKDVAGNIQIQGDGADKFNIDTENPTITSATATPDPAKEGTITITVEFNENMDTTVLPEVQITGITDSPISVTQTGYLNNTWTGTFTLADNNEEKTATISVTGAKDAAGNVMANNTTAGTFIVDTIDPTVSSISVDTAMISDNDLVQEVTVTYNEAMLATPAPTIAFSATTGTWTPVVGTGSWDGAGKVWTQSFTITDVGEKTTGVNITVSGAMDVAGNIQTQGDGTDKFNIDTKNPTATVTTTVNPIYGDALIQTVTVTYDETMNSETSPVITLTGTNWGAQTLIGWTVGNTVYTTTFTHNGTQENIPTAVANASGATDLAGNSEIGDGSPSFVIDTEKPTILSVTPTALAEANAGNVSVTITFSEAMDLTNPTVSITGLAIPYTVTGSWANTTQWTGTFTFADNNEEAIGTYNISGAKDAVGNVMVADNSKTVIVDTKNPTATVITVGTPIISDSDLVQEVTVTYDEVMATTPAPIIAFSATTGIWTPIVGTGSWDGAGKVWTQSFIITDNNEKIDDVDITVTGAIDLAGNTQVSGSLTNAFDIDTENPTAPDSVNMTVTMNAPGAQDTLSGAAGAVEANAIVKVYKEDSLTTLLGTTNAAEDGSFTTFNIGDNQATNNLIYVTATDTVGNQSDRTSMTNDVTAPVAPIITLLDPINSANQTDVSITGIGEANATIAWSITNGAMVNGTGIVGADGLINITGINVSTLNDGILTASVILTDAAGNTGLSGTDTATKDVLALTVEITSPLFETKVNGDAVIIFTNTETTNPQCSVDNTNWNDCESGITKLSDVAGFNELVEGAFTLYLKDTDTAGNTGTDNEAGIIKDSIAPTIINITSDKENGSYTIDEMIGIEVTFSEDITSDEVTVTFNTGGMCVFAITDTNAGTCNYTVATGENTTDLDATVSGAIVDEAGNSMTNFIPDTLLATNKNIIIDTVAPSTTDNVPVDWQNLDVTVTLTCDDLVGGNSGCSKVYYTTDGSEDPTTDSFFVDAASNWQFTITEDGEYSILYRGEDNAGNLGDVRRSDTLRLDKTAPVIDILTPAHTSVTSDVTPEISVGFIEEGSEINPDSVTIIVDGNDQTDYLTQLDENGITYAPTIPLTAGTHTVTVNVSDLAENPAQVSWSFIVNPTVKSISVSTNKTTMLVGNESFVVITALILDNGSPVQGATVNFASTLGIISDVTVTDENGRATAKLKSAEAGNSVVTASYAADSGIIQGTANVVFTEVITDTAAPTATQYPADNAVDVATNVQPYLNFSEAMDESTLTGDNIQLRKIDSAVGIAASLAISANNNGTTRVTITPSSNLDYGAQYYFFIGEGAKDLAGNSLNPTWALNNESSHEFTVIAERAPIASYDIPLTYGWNLISLPLIPTNNNIEMVLADIIGNVNVVWYYDSDTSEWKSFIPGVVGGGLTTMEDGKGYWIFMNSANNTLIVNGSETPAAGPQTLPAYSVIGNKWNLIGLKSADNKSVKNYIIQIGNDDVLWAYKNGSYNLIYPTGAGVMEPGYGYWLYPYGNGYSIVPTN